MERANAPKALTFLGPNSKKPCLDQAQRCLTDREKLTSDLFQAKGSLLRQIFKVQAWHEIKPQARLRLRLIFVGLVPPPPKSSAAVSEEMKFAWLERSSGDQKKRKTAMRWWSFSGTRNYYFSRTWLKLFFLIFGAKWAGLFSVEGTSMYSNELYWCEKQLQALSLQ